MSEAHANAPKTYTRFQVAQRIEHALLLLSFTTLALTGLPQKYPTAGISETILAIFGGIEMARVIHRIAATIFLLESIYHVVLIGYRLFVDRMEATMSPGVKDATDALQAFLYNLGFTKNAPRMGRYNFTEKAEYWAMVWGLVIMAFTGFMLWNPIATTAWFPGVVIPAAKVAHGSEAVLAVLAIFVWHFYNVHLRFFNKSMFTGQLTREQMEEEHALELEAIESGQVREPIPPALYKKRQLIYLPIAILISVAGLYFVYWFVTLEKTAITTVPRISENVPVYSPRTPTPAQTSTPTAEPTAEPTSEPSQAPAAAATEPVAAAPVDPNAPATWNGSIGPLFQQQCASCHGEAAGLALDSYTNLLRGSNNGVVVNRGNAAGSPLVTLQEKGGHPGQFSAEDLAKIKAWIDAGAPEK